MSQKDCQIEQRWALMSLSLAVGRSFAKRTGVSAAQVQSMETILCVQLSVVVRMNMLLKFPWQEKAFVTDETFVFDFLSQNGIAHHVHATFCQCFKRCTKCICVI